MAERDPLLHGGPHAGQRIRADRSQPPPTFNLGGASDCCCHEYRYQPTVGGYVWTEKPCSRAGAFGVGLAVGAPVRFDDCGVCSLAPTATGWVRATQQACPTHGSDRPLMTAKCPRCGSRLTGAFRVGDTWPAHLGPNPRRGYCPIGGRYSITAGELETGRG